MGMITFFCFEMGDYGWPIPCVANTHLADFYLNVKTLGYAEISVK